MNDKEKFEGLKEKMIADNEAKYGAEIRKKYGSGTIDASNKKVKGMSAEKLQKAEELRIRLEHTLKEALADGDPSGSLAQSACELHKQWICLFWPDGMYSKEAHKGLADMYMADERFRAYYENIAPGCTQFLRDAIYAFTVTPA